MGQDTWPSQPTCTDVDEDGYGNPADASCTYPELDCDDTNEDVYPGAPELCDGIDNQCPGDLCHGEVDAHCGTPSPGMANIPCGCFDMGENRWDGDDRDLPVHNVCISPFEMDVHEVTNAEYKACVDDGGCTAPAFSSSYTRTPPPDPAYYGNPTYDNFPVIYVDWSQATDYCTWAGKRLPSEAEWEYAARGGLAGAHYPWEGTITCDDANYGRESVVPPCRDYCHNGVCDNDTHPVGNYAPNGYGLYDMAGNVYEWVNDWFDWNYYRYCVDNAIVNDPPGPATGTHRGWRSGSWRFIGGVLVADRAYSPPSGASDAKGFRCAR